MTQYGGKILYSTVMGTAAVLSKTTRSLEVGGGGVLADLLSRAHVWGTHQAIWQNGRSFSRVRACGMLKIPIRSDRPVKFPGLQDRAKNNHFPGIRFRPGAACCCRRRLSWTECRRTQSGRNRRKKSL